MDVRVALAVVLIVGYVAYKGFERSGGKLPFSLGAGRGRGRSLPARKPPAPDKFAFERVTLDATPANLQSFIRLTGHLERLGFRIVADYAIAGWPDVYCRGLVHRDKPVHAVIVERQGLPAHVELFTLFDDLSALVTSGSEEAEDPSKPAALRFQQIPGLTVDELFVQHLSSIENLYQDQLSPMPATRLAFFEHQRALLVVEHELRKAKRALRTDSLSRALDTLPELPVKSLLRRYGLEDVTEEAPEAEPPQTISSKTVPAQVKAEPKPEPEEAPKRWGIGSSLLSKRLAAREETETGPGESEATSENGRTLVLDPEPSPVSEPEEPVTLELTVEEAPATYELSAPDEPEPVAYDLTTDVTDEPAPSLETPSPLPFEAAPAEPLALPAEETPEVPAPAARVPLPFEIIPEPAEPEASPEAAAPLPFERQPEPAMVAVAPLPFLVGNDEPAAHAAAAEPAIKLPFEIQPEEPAVAVAETSEPPVSLPFEAAAGAKPTCPHCGATLFSSLSSRCSKCKQAVR